MRQSILILLLSFAPQAQALSRPTCEDDFVPFGLELTRVAYAVKCGYLPRKYLTYYTTVFDPATSKLVKPASFDKYPLFAKKEGLRWIVWRPEDHEAGFPDSCTKPRDVEWVGSCVR